MKDINKIICSCGGEAERKKTSKEEESKYGCNRKECCVNAYECNKCKVRWTFTFDAPEPMWD